MKNTHLWLIALLFSTIFSSCVQEAKQTTIFKGTIFDQVTGVPIHNASIDVLHEYESKQKSGSSDWSFGWGSGGGSSYGVVYDKIYSINGKFEWESNERASYETCCSVIDKIKLGYVRADDYFEIGRPFNNNIYEFGETHTVDYTLMPKAYVKFVPKYVDEKDYSNFYIRWLDSEFGRRTNYYTEDTFKLHHVEANTLVNYRIVFDYDTTNFIQKSFMSERGDTTIIEVEL